MFVSKPAVRMRRRTLICLPRHAPIRGQTHGITDRWASNQFTIDQQFVMTRPGYFIDFLWVSGVWNVFFLNGWRFNLATKVDIQKIIHYTRLRDLVSFYSIHLYLGVLTSQAKRMGNYQTFSRSVSVYFCYNFVLDVGECYFTDWSNKTTKNVGFTNTSSRLGKLIES